MNAHELASEVARSYCGAEHLGATPCMTCAQYRTIALRAIYRYLTEIIMEIEETRADVMRNLGMEGDE